MSEEKFFTKLMNICCEIDREVSDMRKGFSLPKSKYDDNYYKGIELFKFEVEEVMNMTETLSSKVSSFSEFESHMDKVEKEFEIQKRKVEAMEIFLVKYGYKPMEITAAVSDESDVNDEVENSPNGLRDESVESLKMPELCPYTTKIISNKEIVQQELQPKQLEHFSPKKTIEKSDCERINFTPMSVNTDHRIKKWLSLVEASSSPYLEYSNDSMRKRNNLTKELMSEEIMEEPTLSSVTQSIVKENLKEETIKMPTLSPYGKKLLQTEESMVIHSRLPLINSVFENNPLTESDYHNSPQLTPFYQKCGISNLNSESQLESPQLYDVTRQIIKSKYSNNEISLPLHENKENNIPENIILTPELSDLTMNLQSEDCSREKDAEIQISLLSPANKMPNESISTPELSDVTVNLLKGLRIAR